MIFITRYVLALIGAFSRPINDLIAYCTPSCLIAEEELPGEDDDDIEMTRRRARRRRLLDLSPN